MEGLIVYKSKYGATHQYACWAGQDLGLDIFTTNDLDHSQMNQSDFVVIGSSVYMGKLLIADWLRQNTVVLQNKKLFLFIVCGTPASQAQKQRDIVSRNIPPQLLDRMDIFFLPGRLIINKLSWKDRLFLKMGTWLEKDPAKKKAMQRDINEVKKENVVELIRAAGKFTSGATPLRHTEYLYKII